MITDQPRPHRPRLILGGVLTLVLVTAGCGSSSDEAADSTAPASAKTSSQPAGSTAATEADTETGAACTEDSNYLSGTSTIIWTPDGKSKHQVAEAKPENTFALTAAGKLDPATIEVDVDEVFAVTLAADSTGISVLKIGCDGGQTMAKGAPAGIYITAPGTYQVTSGIEEIPAGTIKVS